MGARIESVLVLGAGGVLGRRVARLLAAGLPGARVVPASRRGPAALGPGARAADVRDARLPRAGARRRRPRGERRRPLRVRPGAPRRGLRRRAARTTSTSPRTPRFLAALRGAAERAGAASAGVAFVPGCSTTPGLVELLAQGFARVDGLAAVDAWLSLGTRNPLSAALVAGAAAAARPPGPGRRALVRRGRLAPRRRPPPRLRPLSVGSPGRARARRRRARCRSASTPASIAPLLVRALRARGAAPRRRSRTSALAAARARPLLPAARLGRFARLAAGRAARRGARRAGGEVAAAVEVVAVRDGLDVPAAPPLWAARALRAAPRAGRAAPRRPRLARRRPRRPRRPRLRGARGRTLGRVTLRTEAGPLTLLRTALGGPREIAGKLRAAGAHAAPLRSTAGEVERRLDALAARGLAPAPPDAPRSSSSAASTCCAS